MAVNHIVIPCPAWCRHGKRFVMCNTCWQRYIGVCNKVYAWRLIWQRLKGSVRDSLSDMVDWRLQDPRFYSKEREGIMQRQWTIECRADYADPRKNEAIERLVRKAAIELLANMTLLKDEQIPTLAFYSDDLFEGHQDLEIYRLAEEERVRAGVSQEMLDMAAESAAERAVKPNE